jgi:hypothetical protein
MRNSIIIVVIFSVCCFNPACAYDELDEASVIELAPPETRALLPLSVDGSLARPVTDGTPAPVFNGTHWIIGTTTSPLRYSAQLEAGDTLRGAVIYGRRTDINADSRATLELIDAVVQIPQAFSDETLAPDPVDAWRYTALDVRAFDDGITINEDTSVSVRVHGNGVAGDAWAGATFYVLR